MRRYSVYTSIPRPTFCPNPRRLDRILQLCHYENEAEDHLPEAIKITIFTQCSDQRDKIYALQNIIDWGGSPHLLDPDYSQSVQAVFQSLIIRYLKRSQSIELFGLCNIQSRLNNAPSWVPNLSVLQCENLLTNWYTDARTMAQAEYVGSGVLLATGIVISSIAKTHSIVSPLDKKEIHRLAQAVLPDFGRNLYHRGGSTFDAFCRTLTCNSFDDKFHPSRSIWPKFSLCREHLLYMIEKPSVELNDSTLDFPALSSLYTIIRRRVQGRQFCITAGGYIGLVPAASRPGDQICVLLGSRTALVLRQIESGNHEIVGGCYIHGFMEGEALLGPLPPGWHHVWSHGPKVKPRMIFLNRTTGERRLDDPRLGELPKNWHFVSDVEGSSAGFTHQADGSLSPWDPRISPEALRARGVNLTEFLLK